MAWVFNPFTSRLDFYQPSGSVSITSNETLTNTGDDKNFTFAAAPTTVISVWTKETGQVITDYTFLGTTLTLGTAMPGFTIQATYL